MEEEHPKSATEPLSEETSRPSSGSMAGAGQKHEAPQPAGSSGPNTGDPAANQQQSKRRRGLGVVTPNACTECRKKRAKVRLNLKPIDTLPRPSSCPSRLLRTALPTEAFSRVIAK